MSMILATFKQKNKESKSNLYGSNSLGAVNTTTNPTESAMTSEMQRLKIDEYNQSDFGDQSQTMDQKEVVNELVMRRNKEGLNLIE